MYFSFGEGQFGVEDEGGVETAEVGIEVVMNRRSIEVVKCRWPC